jgi:hypothetical protein
MNNFESKLKRLSDTSQIIDKLYGTDWFLRLTSEERVKKINDILVGVTSVNDITSSLDYIKNNKYDSEDRKDNPHHHTNRLD